MGTLKWLHVSKSECVHYIWTHFECTKLGEQLCDFFLCVCILDTFNLCVLLQIILYYIFQMWRKETFLNVLHSFNTGTGVSLPNGWGSHKAGKLMLWITSWIQEQELYHISGHKSNLYVYHCCQLSFALLSHHKLSPDLVVYISQPWSSATALYCACTMLACLSKVKLLVCIYS